MSAREARNPRAEQRYRDAVAIVAKPRPYPTMTAAIESLPPRLRLDYQLICDAYAEVPPAPVLRAVVVNVRQWATDNRVSPQEAMYWIQRIANTQVRITLGEGSEQVSGYRPIMIVEHVQLDDAGDPTLVAVSIPGYGEVLP